MATLFDGGLLASFSWIFTFLFAYVIVYAGLVKTQIFGKGSEGLSAILALCAAIFALFSPLVVNLITFMIPWLVIMMVVGLMIMIFSEYIGVKAGTGRNEGGEVIVNIVIIVVIVLLIIGVGQFYNPGEPSYKGSGSPVYSSESITVTEVTNETQESQDTRPDWLKIVFSTKILGMLLLLAIGAFTIKQMGSITK